MSTDGLRPGVPAANGARVLVVDDEPNITELLSMALRYEGFTVKTAATGRAALTAVTQFSPALVILDVMLPDIDGLEVLKRLNAGGHKVPIIFLTAKDATEDKVHGLTVGGDDYVTKPFSIEELMARVRVVLRRHGSASAEGGKLTLADLEMDDEAHEVRRGTHIVELTTTEYRLLRYLLINAGRVLTRSQILDHVWHYDFGGDASVLETYISYLRRKVDRFKPQFQELQERLVQAQENLDAAEQDAQFVASANRQDDEIASARRSMDVLTANARRHCRKSTSSLSTILG